MPPAISQPNLAIQRVCFPIHDALAPLYYTLVQNSGFQSLGSSARDRRSIGFGPDEVLCTDTYFNSFFELHWRKFTTLDQLDLRLRVSGEGTIRLMRRTPEDQVSVLTCAQFEGDGCEVRLSVPPRQFPTRTLGTLHFDIASGKQGVTLHEAEWLAPCAEQSEVSLVAGFCTFNREEYLLPSLRQVGEDAEVAACLRSIVVVDQGTRAVADHPAYRSLSADISGKMRIVRQGNFGGAGGFTRAIIEALETEGATHIVLMDDDAAIEPESIFRTSRFLSLAKSEIALGGSMLDMLKPLQLYEQSAEFRLRLLQPANVLGDVRLDYPANFDELMAEYTTRYNGWWFMAIPLAIIRKIGLPYPFFIRGDDVEYGYRITAAQVPIVAMPGVAVWHEPFYAKTRGWQNYYEFRNDLALAGLHFAATRTGVVRTFLVRFFKQLLCYDYPEAWLRCKAVEDFCRGPALLECDPADLHGELVAELKRRTIPSHPALQHLPRVQAASAPRIKLFRIASLGVRLILNACRVSPPLEIVPYHVVADGDRLWWEAARADCIGIELPVAGERIILRRSRSAFIRLGLRGLAAAMRLIIRHPQVVRLWKAEGQALSGRTFWNRYLNLPDTAIERRDAA